MRVATLVLNWNGCDDTIECLESLGRLSPGDFAHSIVVIDNGSTDGSPEIFAERFPSVTLLRNEGNLGFAEGMNRGITWASAEGFDFVLLLNNDAVVDAGALDRLVQHAVQTGAGATMPLIRYFDNDDVWHAGATVLRPFFRVQPRPVRNRTEPYRIPVFTACCVLLSVKALEKVGGFDPRYYLYLEDTDLSLRLREAEFDSWLVPTATVRHKVSRSSGGNESPDVLYYLVRNNLLLARDRAAHLPGRLLAYGYVALLTLKIASNVVVRGIPRKRAVWGGLVQAWADFLGGRLGARA